MSILSQTTELLAILPEEDISLVNDLVKRLIKAWDPDFTKLTPNEKKILEESDMEMKNGTYFTDEDIW